MVDKAFETLQSYDWGDDRGALQPIDDALVATQHHAAGRKDLEDRLIAVLQSNATRNGKDFVCRKLKVIGTEASVPALAAMLSDANHTHMARYALESMPSAAAGRALREALPKLTGDARVGVIGSLGVRQDESCVAALASLLGDEDGLTAISAARALAAIRTAEAAKALASAKPHRAAPRAIADASLACAETLLAAGNKIAALAIYKRLSKYDPPKLVKIAATRGMLACAAK